eukprot:symbB.v1.2.014186.t1/scaffold1032.1/size142953/4
MSRQRITEACTAREAADKREALAATAYRQALAAEEEAAQEAVAEGQRESRLHEERAATELERCSTRGAAAKVEADAAERDATKEVEALWKVARQRCQTSEEQEQRRKTEILESTSRTAERLRVHAAQIWCESQKQIAKVLKANEQEVQAAQAACAAQELAAATEGQQLKTELHERLQMIRSEEQDMEVEWTKALNAIEAQQHQDHEDAAQRICAAEHLESCLWAEELAVEEEVYAFEIEEEEAASRILAELEVHQSEAAVQRNVRAEESEEALRPMLMALEAAEHRAFKACQVAEEAERSFHEEAANSLSSAESQERQLQLQRKRLEEEVVEAKNMAQKRIGDEEEKSRVLQLEVQFATEQRSRACWEEICAENLQAAQRMEAIREQEEFLSTQAEELLDDAAHTEVATQKMREAQLHEENAAEGLREAVTEVELALQQILKDCKDQEEAIAQKARLEEVEICEEEVQQLSLAESRWQSAEVRAEMASQRCNDATESTASTKRRYQLEMQELHKKGEKKEASAMAKLLAAEEALSTSLWWCNKQGQIGLKIFTAEELASNMQLEVDGDRSFTRDGIFRDEKSGIGDFK